jgi:predicted enzyme related to lactoylglutathione lyase
VDDVDEAARKAESAGGKVIVAPMDVMTAGRMAIFMDTTGAVIAAWQPGQHLGAQLVNEPGAFIWSELPSSDVAKSKAFYSAVFGWGWGRRRRLPRSPSERPHHRRAHAPASRHARRRARQLARLLRRG